MKALIKSALVCVMAIAAVTASAQPRQGERQQRTPEERAKMMTAQLKKELALNDAQEKSVYDLNLKMAQEMGRNRQNGETERAKMREQMEKRREEQKTEMKKILTDEQFAKWEKMQTERRGDRRQGDSRGQGGQRGPRGQR